MEWILNDLSLKNKYVTATDFISDMECIVKLRFSNQLINQNLLCPRDIGSIDILNNRKFSQVVLTEAPRDLKQQIMTWVSKAGPFWCDRRTENSEDYFEHSGIDVTDFGLGECARKCINKEKIASYSFSGVYGLSPLPIQHGISEDILGLYNIENIWTTEQLLESCLNSIPKPTSWVEALGQLVHYFPQLIFSDYLLEQISQMPFNLTVLNRMKELCRVLEDYINSRNSDGGLSDRSQEILQLHFHGDKAWFSDESESDLLKFEHQLRFIDTRDSVKKPYRFHGKIKTPQVRVYFEWPIPPQQNDIQIVYFGPKITKK